MIWLLAIIIFAVMAWLSFSAADSGQFSDGTTKACVLLMLFSALIVFGSSIMLIIRMCYLGFWI